MTGGPDDPRAHCGATFGRKGQRKAPGGAVQGPRGRLPAGDRRGHVADGLRRALRPHDVPGQAAGRAQPDAGDRPREPRLRREAGRADRRPDRAGGSARRCAGDVREREREGRGKPIKKVQDEAVPAMRSAFEQLRGFFHGFDYAAALDAEPAQTCCGSTSGAIDHVLARGENGNAASAGLRRENPAGSGCASW